ncbi:carbohydrate ABC transporter permease [Spongiactinospora gelatinilytica]|uniref:Carbohydrate ABC transporter permease n=1 Tax=Spongiactinospora gelatinilytica TaxID=2666298 RepID=A0A2W2HRL3_9ACTN|nr:carbohydrate ABC transporter permease [Spongiactinospora gelatinilytica]PZG54255.1 carbohydrate ABC transporter permease [Spongiactinospora gelatinilytica]
MTPHAARRVRVAILTIVMFGVVAVFLSPLAQMALTSLKSERQISQAYAPLLPSDPRAFTYQGRRYDVYLVPVGGEVRELALVEKGRTESGFVDPDRPQDGVITWQGSWRALRPSWTLAPQWSNYADVWNLIDFPRLLFNTAAIALIGTLGTVLSCTLVGYGFARFRFPGRGPLFTLLIATIFLPTTVTLIPTYTVFARIGWVGTWLPLLVPAFFANAYSVFLLRQYFMTIPREMDEAAAIDGAGPLRTLLSVIVPQAWPAISAVTLFNFVYTWNDYFTPLVYLSGRPDLQPLQVGLAAFNGLYTHNPAYIQAGTMMTIAVPVLLFACFQRAFMRGVMSTGVDK